ncbi:MAG: hypothetical protein H6Q66_1852 [Firmicutes bacterium]|nr:hypothetical protein [Bacillota bacterium]
MTKAFIFAGLVVPFFVIGEIIYYMPADKFIYTWLLAIVSIINSIFLLHYYRNRFNLDKAVNFRPLTLRNVVFYDQVVAGITADLLHNEILSKNARELTAEDKQYIRDTIIKHAKDNGLIECGASIVRGIVSKHLLTEVSKREVSNIASHYLAKQGLKSFSAEEMILLD